MAWLNKSFVYRTEEPEKRMSLWASAFFRRGFDGAESKHKSPQQGSGLAAGFRKERENLTQIIPCFPQMLRTRARRSITFLCPHFAARYEDCV
jgi:hypothetical protein